MSARLYPLPESKLDVVWPLLDRVAEEMDTPKLASADQLKQSIARGYENKIMAVYVDNLESPKHCLVLSVTPAVIYEGLVAMVHLVYSVPEERGLPDMTAAMHRTIENYAKFHKAGLILAASWKYGNSRPIDQFWTARGYQTQETLYVKEV